jgi:hypothetical protein
MVNAGVENIVDDTMGPMVPENFLCWQKEIKGLRGRLTDEIKLKGDMIYSSFLQTGTVQGQGHYLVKTRHNIKCS